MVSVVSNRTEGAQRFWNYVSSFNDPDERDPRRLLYPGLDDKKPFYDPSLFPIVKDLEKNFESIKSEIQALDVKIFQPESQPLTRNGQWNVFFFTESGRRNEENCKKCPLISEIIERNETLRDVIAGLAYVSRLEPGTHIFPHTGPVNYRVRCHLGIQVPDGDCFLRAGDEQQKWQVGKCLVFNDRLMHEAWNKTDQTRVVLIIDLWHPDLSKEEIQLLRGLHKFVYQNMEKMNSYWQKNEESRSEAMKAYFKEFH